MSSAGRKIDRLFLISVILLTLAGFVIFLSASLGLLAYDKSNLGAVALKQSVSLIIGVVAFLIFSRVPYVWLRKSAFFILLGAVLVNLLLLIPGLAVHFNGASRWIQLGPVTFQPSELLKIAFIIYFASWIHSARDKIDSVRFGLIPYLILVAILGLLLVVQKDMDTFAIISLTGLIMLFIGGVKIKHIILALCALAIFLSTIVLIRPYALVRVKTYLNRGADAQGAGYQINQSLIAIGSGQLTGRGFGRSIQKFGYLPQPTNDSIFAVAAEEFGFIGSTTLLILYFVFMVSIFRIGNRSPDVFSGLLVIGIGVLIVTESFINISAMMGIIPLSGMPLLFVSHGGTALIITLAITGMVANVSKYSK